MVLLTLVVYGICYLLICNKVEMDSNKKTKLYIFLYLVTLTGIGIGIYVWYDYERRKKINATTVSVNDAKQIILNAK